MCMDQISGVTVSELLRREEKARQCRYSEDLIFFFFKSWEGGIPQAVVYKAVLNPSELTLLAHSS